MQPKFGFPFFTDVLFVVVVVVVALPIKSPNNCSVLKGMGGGAVYKNEMNTITCRVGNLH